MSDEAASPPSSPLPRAPLPAEPTQASRFGKARSAQSGALMEDYVELIADLIGEVDDLRFEGGVKVGAWVGIDTQANFVSEVESVEFGVFNFELFDDAEALATATEAAGILHELIECFFHCVTEGGVTEVSGEGDSLGQVFIQAEGAGKGAGKGGDFDGMGETSPDMIPGSVEGELGFVLEGAKGVTMDDAFPVALEFGSEIVGGF